MDAERKIFKEPDGKFSISIPSNWKYIKAKEVGKNITHQFEIAPGRVFQISCNRIDGHISKVIAYNKIIPHDFDLPNISFLEKFHYKFATVEYHWMALIEDKFIFAAYYYNPQSGERNDMGLELMDVRMSLRHILVHKKESTKEKRVNCELETKANNDYSDIQYWRNPAKKFYKSMSCSEKNETVRISPLNIDVLKLYALLVCKVSHQPNGYFDLVKVRKPLDNPIWWDFVLECDKGFIQVWRTPFILEATYHFDGEFDLEAFFNTNIKRYIQEVETTINNFERHTIYINHYKSYRQCVETLWKEISEIDLTLPQEPQGHVIKKKDEMKNYTEEVKVFSANCIKYHALAKSLILNAAFKVESFLNLIIRIGSTPELRTYPDVLLKFTKQDFRSRVKNLRFYSQILIEDIDVHSSIYSETAYLMTLRNKYVHFEEDTVHNRLGEVFYDRDYPLHQVGEHRPAIDSLIQTFLHPDISTVRKAYETSNNFVKMIELLFVPQLRDDLLFLIEQNPIAYNESKGMYSSVYTPFSLDFFTY